MAKWTKKITKAVSDDIAPDEQLLAGLFLQPAGTIGRAMAGGVGGAAGVALVSRRSAGRDAPSGEGGIAATLPNRPIVVGLTSRRVLVWGYSSLTNKPKGFITDFPSMSLAAVDIDPKKASHAVTLEFVDESRTVREAPKLGNDLDAFVLAWNRIR